jgi:hypothetical protein
MKQSQLKQIIKEEIQSLLSEWGGGNIENDREDLASRRDRERRESMTPKDHWENDIDGYIKHLLDTPSYKKINGKIETIRGIESLEKTLSDHLDDKKSYAYNHAKGRGYYNWMQKVRERYLELKKAGKIKDIDKEKAEREEKEYWDEYHKEFDKKWRR